MNLDFLFELPHYLDAQLQHMQFYGVVGDFVGGVLGTLISLLTIPLLFGTWLTARKSDYRDRTYAIFSEFVKTHEEVISSIKLKNNIGEEVSGRDIFGDLLSAFYSIYKITDSECNKDGRALSTHQKIDIAYTFIFYGSSITAGDELANYPRDLILEIGDKISQNRLQKWKGGGFSGNQNRLSHYYRNLYAAYKFIDESKLKAGEKRSLGKVLRSKLTNYEQAMLALNICSHLGRDWERAGILDRYEPIKNTPRKFMTFGEGAAIRDLFPTISYEYEERSGSRGLFKVEFFGLMICLRIFRKYRL